MRLRLRVFPIFLLLTGLLTGALHAQPQPESTRVVVHAAANDAKLMHDPVGGAFIRIVNTETGEVLAEGVQRGSSGSTDKIMRRPHERGQSIYDTPDAAQFETTLVPGEHVTGDGIVLTLHGFIVEVLQPGPQSVTAGTSLDVRARIRMMCGCPTEPDGLWDSNRYTIRAELVGPDGGVVAQSPLSYAGTTSEYDGSITVPEEGATQLRVVAVDAERANAGTASVSLSMGAE